MEHHLNTCWVCLLETFWTVNVSLEQSVFSFIYKSKKKLVIVLCFCRDTRLEMGRRKSKRKPPPKKKMTGNLDTQFTCPFCNHEKSCDVKM